MAKPALTSFGRTWERWHSLWIGWALGFFGFLSWLSFLYAGLRARERSWLIWAAVYALPWIPFLITAPPEGQEDPPGFGAFDAVMVLFLVLWVVSSIHAFRIRREYLLRIAESRSQRLNTSAAEPTSIASTRSVPGAHRPPAGWYPHPTGVGEQWWDGSAWGQQTRGDSPSAYSHTATASGSSVGSPASSGEAVRHVESPEVVDLNTGREEDIAAVPGIGAILAKRIVAERYEAGGFRSVEAMAVAVGLKPHVLQQVRYRLTVSQVPPEPSARPRGRVVDF